MEYELYHYGIKGMKWGIRRYQNKDGALTPAGKKRVSKEYKKLANKVTDDLNRKYTSLYVNAYNKAADEINSKTDKYNADQRKKYGENFADRDGYIDDYNKMFDRAFAKNWNKTLNEFYSTNANYKKSKELVDKYGMTSWDEFARNNEEAVKEVRRAVEKGI